jgi:hypothetical protein
MRSSLLECVIVTEFQATEAYSSLDLTKAKYSIIDCVRLERKMLLCELAQVRSAPRNRAVNWNPHRLTCELTVTSKERKHA